MPCKLIVCCDIELVVRSKRSHADYAKVNMQEWKVVYGVIERGIGKVQHAVDCRLLKGTNLCLMTACLVWFYCLIGIFMVSKEIVW